METYTGKIYRPWTRSNQRYICTRSRPACWGIGGGILLCFVNIHSYLRKEQRNAILTCVHNVNDETVILLLVEQNVPKNEGQNEVLVYRCTISLACFPILSKYQQNQQNDKLKCFPPVTLSNYTYRIQHHLCTQ